MRVMQVMAGAEHGGAETYFVDLVTALHARGLEQLVVTRPYPERVAALQGAGIPVEPGPFRWPLAPVQKIALRRVIDEYRPDVIHAWMGRAASLLPGSGPPSIGWFGGYYDLKRYGACQHFVGVTDDIARHLVASGAPPARTHAIHTFADLAATPPADRAAHDTPPGATLLLVLARLHQKKGIDIAIRALAELPDCHLWIAGSGELERELRALARELALERRVAFLGWRDDRAALLAAADICLLPSRYEPFGTVMVEAWSLRVPLIAAAAAGPLGTVTDGVDGLLFPIDDAPALAACVRRLTAEPALREHLIEGGHRVFQARFTRAHIVEKYLALYEQAQEKTAPVPRIAPPGVA